MLGLSFLTAVDGVEVQDSRAAAQFSTEVQNGRFQSTHQRSKPEAHGKRSSVARVCKLEHSFKGSSAWCFKCDLKEDIPHAPRHPCRGPPRMQEVYDANTCMRAPA